MKWEKAGRFLVPRYSFDGFDAGIMCGGDGSTIMPTKWNPSDISPNLTLSNANLKIESNSLGDQGAVRSDVKRGAGGGIWVAELTIIKASANLIRLGLLSGGDTLGTYIGGTLNGFGYVDTGSKVNNAIQAGYGSATLSGQIASILWNANAGELSIFVEGANQGVMFSGLSGDYYAAASIFGFNGPLSATNVTANFGATPFVYDSGVYPSGSKSWDGSKTF